MNSSVVSYLKSVGRGLRLEYQTDVKNLRDDWFGPVREVPQLDVASWYFATLKAQVSRLYVFIHALIYTLPLLVGCIIALYVDPGNAYKWALQASRLASVLMVVAEVVGRYDFTKAVKVAVVFNCVVSFTLFPLLATRALGSEIDELAYWYELISLVFFVIAHGGVRMSIAARRRLTAFRRQQADVDP